MFSLFVRCLAAGRTLSRPESRSLVSAVLAWTPGRVKPRDTVIFGLPPPARRRGGEESSSRPPRRNDRHYQA